MFVTKRMIVERVAPRAVETGMEVRVGHVCSLTFPDERFSLVYRLRALAPRR